MVKNIFKDNVTLLSIIAPLIGLIVIVIFLSFLSPYFMTISNFKNIILQSSINIILAVGMTFVIISGGIDLSMGSVVGVTGVFSAILITEHGLFWPISILITLGFGMVIGGINGLLISKGKLPPFIATLGMLGIARALSYIFTNARPVFGMPDGFVKLFSGQIMSIPTPAIIAIMVTLMANFVLTSTPYGSHVFAIGGNEEFSRRFGIKINNVKIKLYVLSGSLSTIACFIQTSRLNAADPNAGLLYELDAVAASVIGGASLSGGKGSIIGTVLGALIMGVIRNGLNLLNIQDYYQRLVIGMIIIGAVLVDTMRSRNI